MEEKKIFANSQFSKELKKLGYHFDLKDSKCKILGEGSFGKVGFYKKNKKTYRAIKIINVLSYIQKYNEIDTIKREQEIIEIINNLSKIKECKGKDKYLLKYKVLFSKSLFNKKIPKYIFLVSNKHGIDLREYYYQNYYEIDLNFIKHIGLQMINAIECLMNIGIVLYDLKPENILINKKKNIKLIDYGGSGYSCNPKIESKCKVDLKNNIKITCNNKIGRNKMKTIKKKKCRKNPFIYTSDYVNPVEITHEKVPLNSDLWSFGIILLEINEIIQKRDNHKVYKDERKKLLSKKSWKNTGLPSQQEIYNFLKNINMDYNLRNLLNKILVINNDKRIDIKIIKKHPFFNK